MVKAAKSCLDGSLDDLRSFRNSTLGRVARDDSLGFLMLQSPGLDSTSRDCLNINDGLDMII